MYSVFLGGKLLLRLLVYRLLESSCSGRLVLESCLLDTADDVEITTQIPVGWQKLRKV